LVNFLNIDFQLNVLYHDVIMKVKENLLLFFIIGFVFVILYLFFAVSSLEDEFLFEPNWTVDISASTERTLSEVDDVTEVVFTQERIPFLSKEKFGYVDTNGNILFQKDYPENNYVAISSRLWSEYVYGSSYLKIFNADNQLLGQINEIGYPCILNDTYFLFYPGGSSFGTYTLEGSLLWKYESYLPITSFSASDAGTLIGYADGKVLYLHKDTGKKILEFYPGGSNYQVIFGTALASSGNYMGVLSGLDKQRFVLAKIQNGQVKTVFHHYLKKAIKQQTLVYFTEQEDFVYFNCGEGLGIVNLKDLTGKIVSLTGDIVQIKEFIDEELIALLVENTDQFEIVILEKQGKKLGSFGFSAETAFIDSQKNQLFVGKDSLISCFTITQ